MGRLAFHCHDLYDLEDLIPGNGLHRGEFYNFNAGELPVLMKFIKSHKLKWSIHTPLVRLDWYPIPHTWSFLCDLSPESRELTMKMIALTMQQAEDLGAEYIVVHLPTEATDAAGESRDKLESVAYQSCNWLAELSLKRGVPIHIEGVGSSLLLDAEFLVKVLRDFTPLRYCFDIAHTYLASQNLGFDYFALARAVNPYLGSVHLWNTRSRRDYLLFHHIPVHPSQRPEDGWVDVSRVLKDLGAARGQIILVFESPPGYPFPLGDHDYRDGVKWVKSMLKISS